MLRACIGLTMALGMVLSSATLWAQGRGPAGFFPGNAYGGPSIDTRFYPWPYYDMRFPATPFVPAPPPIYPVYPAYSWGNETYNSSRYQVQASEGESRSGEMNDREAAGRQPAVEGEPSAGGPLSPFNVELTLDDQPVPASATGSPLVLSSGKHTLRVAGRP